MDPLLSMLCAYSKRDTMKKVTFFTFFIVTNLLFLVLQIHKQSAYVQASYHNQRLEQKVHDLEQEKNSLTQELYELKNPHQLKEYAQTTLSMYPIRLNQIKTITIDDDTL